MLDRIATNLEHYMNLLSARQKLVASNIANADTPGYKTRDIDFQFEFMSLAQNTPLADAKPNVIEPQGLAIKNDGNNVDMDRESRLLAENALRFSLASTLARGQIRTIRNAIQEGRGG
jgi:flagellar basal-body rod protein FlgB